MMRSRHRNAGAAIVLVAAARILTPAPAYAHVGAVVGPADVWRAWTLDPWVLITIGAAAWLYARGTARVWRRAGTGRGIAHRQLRCYAAGVLALMIALLSPLDALGGTLFAAHMLQHELLIAVAAPLLVLGSPLVAFVWALPGEMRVAAGRWTRREPLRTVWPVLSHPLSAWSLHAAAVWLWHAPALYQATLTSDVVHALQHASFFGSALLFWWVLLRPGRQRLGYGIAAPYLFITAMYGSALGALLTLASRPWYPIYAERVTAWGLTPLEDQQLGGLIMWVPFGVVYTAAALAFLAAWLHGLEMRARLAGSRP